MSTESDDRALQALFLPFTEARLSWPAQGGALFLRARDGWPLHSQPRPGLVCEQEFKPEVDALRRSGLEVRPADAQRYPRVLLLPPRQREQARATYAQALSRLQPDGWLVVAQSNDEGGKSCEADLRRLCGPLEVLSKHKCRVMMIGPGAQLDQALAAEWRALDTPQPIANGRFLSRPGVFAWDRIDAASQLLADQLPSDLEGAAADLGAGYGFLSAELLQRCPGISSLDLFEADARALDLAERNLAGFGERVRGRHWHDVTQGLHQRYQVIVCNPPFHAQRSLQRPDIGRRFISAAAEALLPGGRLWLVANRHLAYESVLDAHFGVVRYVLQQQGFKVVEAIRHPAPRP